jgi:Mrp family chromosome partitioning ATPase
MPVSEAIAILLGLLQAAPALLNEITAAQASPGGVVPAAAIAALFSKYGVDRAVLAAAIANAAAQGK